LANATKKRQGATRPGEGSVTKKANRGVNKLQTISWERSKGENQVKGLWPEGVFPRKRARRTARRGGRPAQAHLGSQSLQRSPGNQRFTQVQKQGKKKGKKEVQSNTAPGR